jgi:hypothetical protein
MGSQARLPEGYAISEDLQHQTGRNHAWCRPLPSVFVDDCDCASFSHRCRECFNTSRWLNRGDQGIGKGERRRELHQNSNGLDGGGGSQRCQTHVFDQTGIGQRSILRSIGYLQSGRHVFQTMPMLWEIQPACDVQRITYIMGWIGDAQSCERHRAKAQVKKGIVRQLAHTTVRHARP